MSTVQNFPSMRNGPPVLVQIASTISIASTIICGLFLPVLKSCASLGNAPGGESGDVATAGHMIEPHGAVRQRDRVVIGQEVRRSAQTNVAGELGRGRDHYLGSWARFTTECVVLREIHFFPTEPISPLGEGEIPVDDFLCRASPVA